MCICVNEKPTIVLTPGIPGISNDQLEIKIGDWEFSAEIDDDGKAQIRLINKLFGISTEQLFELNQNKHC